MDPHRRQVGVYLAEMINNNFDAGEQIKAIRKSIERTESYIVAITFLAYLVTGIVLLSLVCYVCARNSNIKQQRLKQHRLNACNRIVEA
ncbi:hypothetical protein TTRE_0000661301 [Trichuris trichiura]|uniref:Uncharacterized protein n=1 Tax=Trichuris trichiura TaxID=36087 RepID=A0A077ZD31_TRITR|nr:hypothetical protein TTRE_0000661301 [Trichuris trichiura]